MNKVRTIFKLWLPVMAYAVLIFSLSSFEMPLAAKLEVTNIDKLIHLLEYSIFGFLLIKAIHGSDATLSRNVAIMLAFVIGTLYGFTDELHQSVIPGRYATISDFIFDSIGSFLGALTFKWRR